MFFQRFSPIKGSFCARQPILRFGWMADFCTQKLAKGRSLTQFLLQHRNEFTVEEKSGVLMKVPGAKWCQCVNQWVFLTKQCYPNVSSLSERRCAMCFFHAPNAADVAGFFGIVRKLVQFRIFEITTSCSTVGALFGRKSRKHASFRIGPILCCPPWAQANH